jgi:ABC-2 type transport system permease protein
MTRSLVLRLMVKDWYISRVALVIIAGTGAVSLASLNLASDFMRVLAMIVSLMAVIFLGSLMPSLTIVNERKRQNLAFIMSLPISPMQYTAAKVGANLAAFLALWVPIAGGVIGTAILAGTVGGAVPFLVVAALAPFAGFAIFLAVALVSESETWAITAMAGCNVSYSFVWLFLSRVPGFWEDLRSPVPIWSTPMLSIIVSELAIVGLAIGLTFYLQSRKTDFVC